MKAPDISEIERCEALDSDVAEECISTPVYRELWRTGHSKPFNTNLGKHREKTVCIAGRQCGGPHLLSFSEHNPPPADSMSVVIENSKIYRYILKNDLQARTVSPFFNPILLLTTTEYRNYTTTMLFYKSLLEAFFENKKICQRGEVYIYISLLVRLWKQKVENYGSND